jgi:hypothetical protein
MAPNTFFAGITSGFADFSFAGAALAAADFDEGSAFAAGGFGSDFEVAELAGASV